MVCPLSYSNGITRNYKDDMIIMYIFDTELEMVASCGSGDHHNLHEAYSLIREPICAACRHWLTISTTFWKIAHGPVSTLY
jgi:hypothetical protein